MKLKIVITIFILFVLSNVKAFEIIGTGGRPGAMGNSYAGLAEGNISIFYNPAGLAVNPDISISMSHSLLYTGLDIDNISKNYLIISKKLKTSSGKSFVVTPCYQKLSADLFIEQSVILSLASDYFKENNILAGMNIKYLGRKFESNKYTVNNPYFNKFGYKRDALSWDIGLLYISEDFSLGLSLMNLNKPDIGLGAADIIERETRIGFSSKIKKIDIVYNIDFSRSKYNSAHAGIEKSIFDKLIALRSGFETGDNSLRNLTFGFGINIKKNSTRIIIDYAFQMGLNEVSSGTNGTHQFMLTLK